MRRTGKCVLSAAFWLVLANLPGASAQQPGDVAERHQIVIEVRDEETGAPIRGARIFIRDPKMRRDARLVTGARGIARWRWSGGVVHFQVRRGDQLVGRSHEGYRDCRLVVELPRPLVLDVEVLDREGRPQRGVPLLVQGASGASAITAENGRARLADSHVERARERAREERRPFRVYARIIASEGYSCEVPFDSAPTRVLRIVIPDSAPVRVVLVDEAGLPCSEEDGRLSLSCAGSLGLHFPLTLEKGQYIHPCVALGMDLRAVVRIAGGGVRREARGPSSSARGVERVLAIRRDEGAELRGQVLDLEGKPIAKSFVDFELSTRRARIGYVMLDERGRYRLGLTAEEARSTTAAILRCFQLYGGPRSEVLRAEVPVRFPLQERIHELPTLRLDRGRAPVEGRICREDGEPIASATVQIVDGEPYRWTLLSSRYGTVSDERGRFRIDRLPGSPEDCALMVTAPGYHQAEPFPGLTTAEPMEIVLVDEGRLQVSLLSDEPELLPHVVGYLSRSSIPQAMRSEKVKAGSDALRWSSLGAGRHRLVVATRETDHVVHVLEGLVVRAGEETRAPAVDLRGRLRLLRLRFVDPGGGAIESGLMSLDSGHFHRFERGELVLAAGSERSLSFRVEAEGYRPARIRGLRTAKKITLQPLRSVRLRPSNAPRRTWLRAVDLPALELVPSEYGEMPFGSSHGKWSRFEIEANGELVVTVDAPGSYRLRRKLRGGPEGGAIRLSSIPIEVGTRDSGASIEIEMPVAFLTGIASDSAGERSDDPADTALAAAVTSIAQTILYLNISDPLHDRPLGWSPYRRRLIPPVDLRPFRQLQTLMHHTAAREWLPLLEHRDARVRSIAVAALCLTGEPRWLPWIARRTDDAAVAFPQLDGWGFLPERTVRDAARAALEFYMRASPRSVVRGRRSGFLDYWEERKDRAHCLGWFQAARARAIQGRNPVPEGRESELRALREHIDALDSPYREWLLIYLGGQRGHEAFVTAQERLEAARRIGSAGLMEALRDQVPVDDPDMPGATVPRRFILANAVHLLEARHADELLRLGQEQRLRDDWLEVARPSEWWAIAAANLAPARSSEILLEAFGEYSQERWAHGQVSRGNLALALARHDLEAHRPFLREWFFAEHPRPGADGFGRDGFARSLERPELKDLLLAILRDPRLADLEHRTLRSLAEVINRIAAEPVFASEELRVPGHPLGLDRYGFMLEEAWEKYPEETRALEAHLQRWREKMRAFAR